MDRGSWVILQQSLHRLCWLQDPWQLHMFLGFLAAPDLLATFGHVRHSGAAEGHGDALLHLSSTITGG